MQDRALSNPKINVLWNTIITGYKGSGKLEYILTRNVETGEDKELAAGGLFMAIGHDPLTRHVHGSGLDMDGAGYIQVREGVHTNIDGVFAAGDVHDQHFRQAITAAGFGCMAAIACERWLEAKSTSKL
jgi:thioredoxin reductase (NADPH)